MQARLWLGTCTVQSMLRRYCPVRRGVTVSPLDLPSLTPLSIVGFGRLQLGVAHCACATSVALLKKLIIGPQNSCCRFSCWEIRAIEDFTFVWSELGLLLLFK